VEVEVNGTSAPTTSASCSGCSIEIAEYSIAPAPGVGVSVSRQFYAPDSTDFLRILDSFTSNITTTFEINYVSDLGSDSSTEILRDSSGDTNVTIGDRWAVSWEGDTPANENDPVVSFIWQGQSGSVSISSIVYADGSGTVNYDFTLTLNAGETAYFMTFLGQHTSVTRAYAVVNSLGGEVLPSQAVEALSSDELDGIQNWRPCALGTGWYTVNENCGLGASVTVNVPTGSSLTFELLDSLSTSLGVATSFTGLDSGSYTMRCTDGSGSLDSTFTVTCPFCSSGATLNSWLVNLVQSLFTQYV
jgi:hypothetical protein